MQKKLERGSTCVHNIVMQNWSYASSPKHFELFPQSLTSLLRVHVGCRSQSHVGKAAVGEGRCKTTKIHLGSAQPLFSLCWEMVCEFAKSQTVENGVHSLSKMFCLCWCLPCHTPHESFRNSNLALPRHGSLSSNTRVVVSGFPQGCRPHQLACHSKHLF